MVVTVVQSPFAQFVNAAGVPLEGAKIYIGVSGQNPETTPKQIYLNESLTTAAAQPIRTVGGYPSVAGRPTQFFCDGAYSITVKTSGDVLVFSILTNTQFGSAEFYAAAAAASAAQAALYGGVQVDTFAELVALTSGQVAVGKYAQVRSSGAWYQRAADAAVDGHLGHTASALKWYVQPTASGYDVRAFGALGGGVTDDTVAIQKALDIAVALDAKGVFSPVTHKITATLFIDRVVDGAAFDAYFRVAIARLYVTTGVTMFGTRLAYSGIPVVQLVHFDGMEFRASSSSLGAYVLDNNKYLRTMFTGCDFVKIRCLVTTGYIQSIYFHNCQARRITGKFFDVTGVAFDLKVTGFLGEASAQWFNTGVAQGCIFSGNNFEGSGGAAALTFRGSQGLSIHANYFESNAIDIDLSQGSHLGISVMANAFMETTSVGGYNVFWGIVDGGHCGGNYANQRLHYFNSPLTVTNFDMGTDYAAIAVRNLNPFASAITAGINITLGTGIDLPVSLLSNDNAVTASGTLTALAAISAGAVVGTIAVRHRPDRAVYGSAFVTGVGQTYYVITSAGLISVGVAMAIGQVAHLSGITYAKTAA